MIIDTHNGGLETSGPSPHWRARFTTLLLYLLPSASRPPRPASFPDERVDRRHRADPPGEPPAAPAPSLARPSANHPQPRTDDVALRRTEDTAINE